MKRMRGKEKKEKDLSKRYFRIDQQIARHLVHNIECFSNPLPFYATQKIKPFLN